ncbi:hypothetical protein HMPREF0004_4222 [Achromobacter piechaudii ATCC 43553]|uniref:Uncharacterized protein n=1 Tax=Achromobacter piechaudii ATCC 43553 TaxID=742159 RepID=D4XFH5_9BURK|nr:hypothetical protein HMPREF0004_4222 [Achromobacter piechaudii ATCC 43553]
MAGVAKLALRVARHVLAVRRARCVLAGVTALAHGLAQHVLAAGPQSRCGARPAYLGSDAVAA